MNGKINIKKILLPWEFDNTYSIITYRRHFVFDERNFIYIVKCINAEEYYLNHSNHSENFFLFCGKSFEEAKCNVDKYLIENGYLLISKDKADQYRVVYG
jgi:hypothetical protein